VIPFRAEIQADNRTGGLATAYFYIRKGKVHETREYADGNVFADYNHAGELLGVELLGPCDVRVFDRLTRGEPKPVKNFLRRAKQLVA
jgi:hypothetical protein